MKAKRIGPVELTNDGDRLVLRYSRRFVIRAAAILTVLTILAAALVGFPIAAALRGRFLEVVTVAVFSLCIGLPIAIWAITGWAHILAYRRREIVFDRIAAKCTVPVGLTARRMLALGEIKGVRLERKRSLPGVYRNTDSPELWSTHIIDKERIVLALSDARTQPLWGRLGLTSCAEEVAETIADFLKLKLQVVQTSK